MRESKPQVFLIGETQINMNEVQRYFDYKNETTGKDKPPIVWKPTTSNSIELITEFYGRGCYESWSAESTSNKNISKIRASSEDYLQNIIKSGHGSVLEHGWVNFKFADVSRVFTHELVRHRVGTAISQLSNRYYFSGEYGIGSIREQILGDNSLVTIEEGEEGLQVIVDCINHVENEVGKLTEIFRLNDGNFERKKKLTSLIRRIAPEGQSTDIGWSANIRTLRHVIESRTNRSAEWEIRYVFGIVGSILRDKYPYLFNDYTSSVVNGMLEYSTKYSKA